MTTNEKDKLDIRRELVKKLYFDENMSVIDIAEMFNISCDCVKNDIYIIQGIKVLKRKNKVKSYAQILKESTELEKKLGYIWHGEYIKEIRV